MGLLWPLLVAVRLQGRGRMTLVSTLAMSGLVIGVAVLVLVLSVMNGFETELRERVLEVLPHGSILAGVGDTGPMPALDEVLEEARTHPEVKNVTPVNTGRGLLIVGDVLRGIRFDGVEPAGAGVKAGIARFVVSGALDQLQPGGFNMLVGARLAREAGLSLGDKVTVVLPEARVGIAGILPRTKRFTVVGTFRVGADMDAETVFIHLDDAARLLRQPGVQQVRLALTDLFEAPRVVREILARVGNPALYGTSWMHSHGNLYQAIRMQKTTMFLLLLLLIAVAAFNVVASLVITVNDRRQDIAVLRTLGADRQAIGMVFLVHGIIVGALGIGAGLTLGALCATAAPSAYAAIDGALNLGLMDEYFIHYLPSEVYLTDIWNIAVASLGITLLASVYPAFRAAGTDPVEILQYEA
ncbi:MAG: lipoprotein-releasing system transmembrane subunit LolC [Gammaproteobacteria bacterium]|nr:lipoprotein-releasing system transmembrane subunit LolC [Gammaproteobacteria bacterium]